MKRFKHGFTLVEVIVTLGIIGIITAMLLPKFFEAVNKKVAVETLFSSHAKIETAFKKAMADDQVFDLKETDLFQSIGGDGICNSDMDPNGTECKDFFTNLKKYIKIADVKNTDYHDIISLNGDSAYIYGEFNNVRFSPNDVANSIYLHDGTVIYAYQFSKNSVQAEVDPNSFESYILLDINGKEKPNQLGRDIFSFRFSKDGTLQPEYSPNAIKEEFYNWLICTQGFSQKDALEVANREYLPAWEDISRQLSACYNYPDKDWGDGNCGGGSCGQGCAAKIFEEHGMNY